MVWQPSTEPVVHVTCGLNFLALCVRRSSASSTSGPTSVLTCGSFCRYHDRPHALKEWQELRDVPLRQLVAGGFHCCALSTRGELYTFGDSFGKDTANGNLLGHGDNQGHSQAPRQVITDGFGPVAEVACSTYTTIAITMDGRVFSWGDCDGDALGHTVMPCHTPHWLRSLRWQRLTHGSLSYTNAAVATDEGRVFVWGGNMWEGGIAGGRETAGPSEVKWAGVPSCYHCSSVALGQCHGYLIFRRTAH